MRNSSLSSECWVPSTTPTPTGRLQHQWLATTAREGLGRGGMRLPWAAAVLSRGTTAHECGFAVASLMACAHSYIGI